ncbi:hypothetical protein E2C01_064873 [Portunus trituberculatus]|uniref:Uncharacterized protein n=1 Tax=Portunus trituberculatus TaxID=210409 RepID=A0A5B7HLJ2_PORTR|nr:hypothetical protein [Portunus trituberculatus]
MERLGILTHDHHSSITALGRRVMHLPSPHFFKVLVSTSVTEWFLLELWKAMEEVIEYLMEMWGLHATPPYVDTCGDLMMFVSKLVELQEQRVSRLRKEEFGY